MVRVPSSEFQRRYPLNDGARLRSLLTIVVAALSAIAISGCAGNRDPTPIAVEGVLDLRDWNFDRDGTLRLSADRVFAPGLRLEGTEAATYRLKVLLPTSRPPLGILYSTVSSALELESDGLLVQYRPGIARIADGPDSVTLVVRMSNYEYRVGGMRRSFVVGPVESLERRSWLNETSAMAVAAAIAMLALVFACFIRRGTEGRGFASFSLFAMGAALLSLVMGEGALARLFPTMGFDLLVRLEYLGVFSLFPLGLIFFSSLFPEDRAPRATKALLALCAAFLVLVPFAPLRVLASSILPYYALAFAVLVAIVAIQARAIAHRRVGGIALSIGTLALVLATVNDILFSNYMVNTEYLFPYGMLVFIGAQAQALAKRNGWTQDGLRTALAENELLIKEVHHRVKNSLQIVSSIASLQSHRDKDPAILAACASMQARIRAISLVHEKLYVMASDEVIDVGAYARELSALLAESYGAAGEDAPVVEAEREEIKADLCLDIGLIMTELVSNAYKYAGEPGRRGRILVRLGREGMDLCLVVEDEGPGFPDGASLDGFSTLGFRLVSSLAKKHEASVKIGRGRGGAVVEVRFPLKTRGAVPLAGG